MAALSGLLLAGCASVAHVEKDKTVDLNNYQTFAWVETKASQNDTAKTKVSDLTERMIKETVNEELAKAGWKQSSKPDVLLTYDVLVEKAIKEQNNPVYTQPFTRYFYNPYSRRWNSLYYPSRFAGYDRDEREVREGTITISLIDSKSDKTIWQGWTTDEVNSRNLTSKEIRNSIRSIFRKFDVAKN
ncbi:MAG TPA: DUF4136 domain-containing protein [Flavisolibacter sp.]